MRKSTTSIIKHISIFLDYCKFEKGLSDNTQENYKRYLSKFIFWLNKKNKQKIKPDDLTTSDIENYTLFLSKDKHLKKITQNHYLIALRALLSYFSSKDIESLQANKIGLPKGFKRSKVVKPISLTKIKQLLAVPNIKTIIGLRDRAILATFIYTGLKISELINLNQEQFINISGKKDLELSIAARDSASRKIYFSEDVLRYVKEYLNTRKDGEKALFTHYRSRKDAENRLRPRSIQRMVKHYEKSIKLPYSITPEILRWSYINAVVSEHTNPRPIFQSLTHQESLVKNYNYVPAKNTQKRNPKKSSLKWHIIELLINKEINWLKEVLITLPERYKDGAFLSEYNILRNMAIGIISGQFKATEFCAKDSKSLWDNLISKTNFKKISFHGKEWHRNMMTIIHKYFKRQNYEVDIEPILNYGRADLRVYPTLDNPLYIEVGTVSLFKLWYNLLTIRNVVFLIVPSKDYLIEFRN